MAVAEILAPKPGDRVLDLAAAPGGKTTHLAALMQNQGLLVANEMHPRRVWDLAENLERCGVTNAAITNETPARLANQFGAFFDRVLLDAPCSGEGMFRKSQAARDEWSAGLPHTCAIRQSAILEDAARTVRPGGCLVYSTCTFSPEENELVIAQFLDRHDEFHLMPAPNYTGFSQGRPEWAGYTHHPLQNTVRLWPHHLNGEGHFIALLQKSVNATGDTILAGTSESGIKGEDNTLFQEFWRTTLSAPLPEGRIAHAGSYLYLLPEGLPDMRGLKVIHPGWWLGTCKKGRFEPAHALAMGLHTEHCQRTLDMQRDSPRVRAYLHGESLQAGGEPGWLIATVEGYPLGWGKRVNDIVKNSYPRGLRRISG